MIIIKHASSFLKFYFTLINIQFTRSQSETSESSELSQTAELLTPDSSSPSTPKQPTMMQHQLQCLQNSQDTSNSNQGKKVRHEAAWGITITDINEVLQ